VLKYTAVFQPDADTGGFVVRFPDLDYGATQGDTISEASEMARDFLSTVLGELIRRDEAIPAPRKHRVKNMRLVSLPALQDAKVSLYLAMREAGLRRSDFAKRLGKSKAYVDRLFDLNEESRWEQIEGAFLQLGKRIALVVEDAA
jgi:antitoxin HicB